MTYCERKLKQIYDNFTFSLGVYCHNEHLMGILYVDALNQLNNQIIRLKKVRYPQGELTYFANHYRRLMTQYYESHQALA